jgi:hypothetical protein
MSDEENSEWNEARLLYAYLPEFAGLFFGLAFAIRLTASSKFPSILKASLRAFPSRSCSLNSLTIFSMSILIDLFFIGSPESDTESRSPQQRLKRNARNVEPLAHIGNLGNIWTLEPKFIRDDGSFFYFSLRDNPSVRFC